MIKKILSDKQSDYYKSFIRTVEDFPFVGISFRDITTLLNTNASYKLINEIKLYFNENNIKFDIIAGLEARGFIFGFALAYAMEIPFIPIRKEGKLPYDVYKQTYITEYSEDNIEIHTDALINIKKNPSVLLIDDVIATGGSALAALKLLENFDTEAISFLTIINLKMLNGLDKLNSINNYYCIDI
jgi:adenine phosphoribosyltransferase